MYAWLEEINFRTGVTVLIVVAAIVIGGTIAAIDLAAFGGPSAVRHAPVAQALPATPQTASTAPASRPETALPRPQHDPRHTAVPVAAAIPAAAQTPPNARPGSAPRPSHHHGRGLTGGWRPGHGHGRPSGHRHGGPGGDEQGQPGEHGHGWLGRGSDGRHAGARERGRHGRQAGHAAGRHERHPGDPGARRRAGRAGRAGRDPRGRQADRIARQH